MDRIAGHNIYVGSLFALRNQDALRAAKITHVVSVVTPAERAAATSCLQTYDAARGRHLVLLLRDLGSEDILQHFPQACRFIQAAVVRGGVVLVNCGMGVSRSATIVLAYMLYHGRPQLRPGDALRVLQGSRAACQPNPGFMEQLEQYHRMGCPDSPEDGEIDSQHVYTTDT